MFRLGAAVRPKWCGTQDGLGRLCCGFVLVFAHHLICRRIVSLSSASPWESDALCEVDTPVKLASIGSDLSNTNEYTIHFHIRFTMLS